MEGGRGWGRRIESLWLFFSGFGRMLYLRCLGGGGVLEERGVGARDIVGVFRMLGGG